MFWGSTLRYLEENNAEHADSTQKSPRSNQNLNPGPFYHETKTMALWLHINVWGSEGQMWIYPFLPITTVRLFLLLLQLQACFCCSQTLWQLPLCSLFFRARSWFFSGGNRNNVSKLGTSPRVEALEELTGTHDFFITFLIWVSMMHIHHSAVVVCCKPNAS